MEALHNDPILQFHSDTLMTIRRLYNLEKKESMDEAVNILDEWVKKQNHFTKKYFPRNYLERSIMQLKGSVERTKLQLERVCTMRTLLPKYFTPSNPEQEFEYLKSRLAEVLLPKLTKEHYRVFALRFNNKNVNSKLFFSIYRFGILLCEYMKSCDYIDGLVAIIDLLNINMLEFVSNMDLVEFREIAAIVTECYQLRIKAVHIITESKSVDLLLKIVRQAVSAKIGSRIQVHRNYESVFNHVPKEILPQEWGGNEKSITELYNDWINLFSTESSLKYFKEMSEACTDESIRQTDTFNDQYMGIAGTFRRLNVD